MHQSLILIASLCLSFSTQAEGPSKLEAPLKKEPAYQSQTLLYCLLVFNEDRATKVWVVVDGDQLYIDRNANGDLTEPGEMYRFSPFRPSSFAEYEQEREVRGLRIEANGKTHLDFRITQRMVKPALIASAERHKPLIALLEKNVRPIVWEIAGEVEMQALPFGKLDFSGRIHMTAGEDANSFLTFAPRPEDAPVIHFGGPWQMSLICQQTLSRGDKPDDLKTMIGTPGRGAGTFASIWYGGVINEGVHPTVEILFPPSDKTKTPIREKIKLPYRC